MIIKFIIGIAATFTVIIPVIAPKLEPNNKYLKKIVNYWIVIFIFSTIITFAGGMYEFDRSQKELYRLTNNDFQIRLNATYRGAQRTIFNFSDNFPIYFKGKLGNADIEAEFIEVGNSIKNVISIFSAGYNDRRHGLGGTSEFGFRFYAKNITIGGLEEYPFLNDLKGLEMSFDIDLDKFDKPLERWSFIVDLYVMGRHYQDTVNSQGNITIFIN